MRLSLNLALGLTLLAGVLQLGCLWGQDDEPVTANELKKELVKAIKTHGTSRAQWVADQLAAMQTKEAIDVLADVGLKGDNYDLERHIGGRLVAMPSAEALERMIYHANRNKDHRVRIVMSVVLSKRKEPAAFDALMANLEDRYPGVVIAVLEVVQETENLSAVGPLIDALAFHERASGGGDGLIKFEIRTALTRLTGYDSDESQDWKRFWQPYRKDHSAFQKKGSKADAGTAVVLRRPSFFDIEIPDDRVLFVLDISGSMMKKDAAPEETGKGGDGKDGGPLTGVVKKKKKKKKEKIPQDQIPDSRRRLARVQAELVRVLQELPIKVKFNILTFNHQIDEFQDELVPATPKNKQLAIRYVTNVAAEGQTHTDEAIDRAFDVQGVTSIYLLSDGAPRRDDVLLPTKPILQRTRELNRFRRVKIHAIGFEQAGRNLRRFMSKLAFQNHGKFKQLR
ncbi:MAG: hypothetical protein AAF581_15345 [Planctomycetota bacterium]